MPRVHAFEERLHAVDDIVVLEATGGRDDDVGRPVVVAEELGDVIAPQRRNRVHVAEHLAPERMAREDGIGEQRVNLVVGSVLRQGELFEDHFALGVDLGRAQCRLGQHVAQQLEAEAELVGRKARVVGGVLTGGERVHLAAHRVDGLGDVARASARRALEDEMLEEV